MKINLLVLRTSRLEELRRFYSDLGVKFENEKHGNGPKHYAATMSDDFVLELYPILDGSIPDAGLRLGLKVDDIEKTLRSLGQTATPRNTPMGLRATVRDPDGRTVELLQSPTDATCAA
ncbi:MAG TPA: VOC family protein [Candidatus Obscuribacterales bacterium]